MILDKLFGNKKRVGTSYSDVEDVNAALDRYDRIFKGSRGYGFLDWDLQTKRAHWHGGFWPHLGYETDQINQITHADEFLKIVHPDDREPFFSDIIKLLKGQDNPDLIFRVAKASGEYIWVELRLEAERRLDGWVTHLSGLAFDVSALKRTEEALKISEARHARIIDGSNDGIWEWSASDGGKRMRQTENGEWQWSMQEGSFTFSSRCWEMIGFTPDDEIVKQGLVAWRSLMNEDDGRRFDKALHDHIFKQEPFEVEYRIRGKDGEWRWIRGRGQLTFDRDGRPHMFSGTNVDLTDLKRAEERVLKAKEEAEKASHAKSEFLSSMSHELRTPLNAILGFSQLMELDQRLSGEHRDNVKEIKNAGQHLLELVGDVLDLAKIEAGHLKLKLDRVLPSRIINECVALLKSQCEKYEVNLEIQFNGLETQTIYADPMRLKQVIINLLGNAIKYNKKGGLATVECSMLASGKMRILVKDNGKGIPENLQSQLFQPFNRLGAERSGIEGSGVGLVITQQLVQHMGGEINFKSEEKIGSEFWADFCVSKSDAEEEIQLDQLDPTKVIIDEEMPELKLSEVKKVLYVEDNPSNQKLMKQVLAKFPMLDLNVVGLAVQGLFEARSTTPDLIILDVNLPGINGFEIVEILKQDNNTKHIPVIALSANVLAHDVEQGLAAGFDHYLTKPLNLAELVNVCNRLIGD